MFWSATGVRSCVVVLPGPAGVAPPSRGRIRCVPVSPSWQSSRVRGYLGDRRSWARPSDVEAAPAQRAPRARTESARDRQFREKAEALGRFISENGRLPKLVEAHEKARRLAEWLKSVKRAPAQLTPERLELLQSVMGDWYNTVTDAMEGISRKDRHFADMAKLAGRFVEAEGRAPFRYDKFEDRPIGGWFRKAKQRLTPEREAILEREMGPHFAASFKPDFSESVDAIAAFRAAHGTLPHLNYKHNDLDIQAEARRLGRFLTRLRLDLSAGVLKDDHARVLDERLPGWRPAFSSFEERWDARLTEATTWVGKHGRLPGWTRECAEESSIARWLDHQRHQLLRSRLPQRRLLALDDALPGWRPAELRDAGEADLMVEPTESEAEREAIWNDTLSQLCTFVAQKQRLPRDVNQDPRTSTEMRLRKWLETQLQQAAVGRLDSERGKRLDAAVPDWQNRMRPAAQRRRLTWQASLQCLARFYVAKGRWPSRFEREGGCGVGDWLDKQRYALKKGELLPDRLQALNEVVPGWDLPRKSRKRES